MFNRTFNIEGRMIGDGAPPLVVAEISGNHGGSLENALDLITACADAGAEAVKFQTYTPDTITLKSDAPAFCVQGKLWSGRTLHELYQEAHTPFEWHEALFSHARALGLIAFSAPFDETAVDLLVGLHAPAYKIASCELPDVGLIAKVAKTGKPVMVSTGAADDAELAEGLAVLSGAGVRDVCVLHCVSSYPTALEDASLSSIPYIREKHAVSAGFSDHTLGLSAALASVPLGACVIEKHVCLSREDGTVDSAFSLQPDELKALVAQTRQIFSMMGKPKTAPLEAEKESLRFKRSLYIAKDLKKGDRLDAASVRSVRPAGGLHPRHLPEVLGREITRDVPQGSPLGWDMLD
ncbi:pseudaminic acid synthase [Kordiimonas aestuarii]|uniref:pseudaminic acid synthase n=1 Tax=Kordiimonas aestuarii TaxID=1005925 RepID=UPI0021D2A4E4|nr:pseudaminic acid synthase [Kordiimonas aestuarii]